MFINIKTTKKLANNNRNDLLIKLISFNFIALIAKINENFLFQMLFKIKSNVPNWVHVEIYLPCIFARVQIGFFIFSIEIGLISSFPY